MKILHFHTPSGQPHSVMPGQITDVRAPIDTEYGPGVRAVIVLQGTKIGVAETVAQVNSAIEALLD